jgi:hypothetical protein
MISHLSFGVMENIKKDYIVISSSGTRTRIGRVKTYDTNPCTNEDGELKERGFLRYLNGIGSWK